MHLSEAAPIQVNYFNPPSSWRALAEPQREPSPPIETTEVMLHTMSDIAAEDGRHVECGEALATLIDVATFKDAPPTAAVAEELLLALYANPDVSHTTRREMMLQLSAAQKHIADDIFGDNTYFAMPASLLHLLAQYAHKQLALCAPNPLVDAARLDTINAQLEEASTLGREDNISNPDRFVTNDEITASFQHATCGYGMEINLNDDMTDEAVAWQLDNFFTTAQASEITVAPLVVGDHFMLLVAEHDALAQTFDLTIVNTKLLIDQIAHEQMCALPPSDQTPGIIHDIKSDSDKRQIKIIAAKLRSGFGHAIKSIHPMSVDCQDHALNSCAALTTLILKKLDGGRAMLDFDVRQSVRDYFDNWNMRGPLAQQNEVRAQRSRMMGDLVEDKKGSRFLHR